MSARRDAAIAVGLGVVAFVLRMALRANVPVEWDSVQLVSGVDRFDVRHGSPHPPGYWLMIASGRVLHAVGFSPLTSLTIVAALASCAAVAVAYLTGVRISGVGLGLATGAFLATAPIVVFYGTFPNSYASDLLAATTLIYLAARARPGGREHVWAALVIGLAAGFRQSALLVFLPIGLFIVWRVRRGWRGVGGAAAVGAGAVLLWLVPATVEQPGGLPAIVRETRELWGGAGGRTSILEGAGFGAWWDNVLLTWSWTFVCLVLLVVVIAAALAGWTLERFGVGERRGASPRHAETEGVRSGVGERRGAFPRHAERLESRTRDVVVMLLLAGVPGLLVTMLHFGKAGYVLSYLPAFVLLLLYPVFELPGLARAFALAAAIAIALLNGAVYLNGASALPDAVLRNVPVVRDVDNGYPYPVTDHTVDAVERDTHSWEPLREELDPARDRLVFVGDEGRLRMRQVMWALPEFGGSLVERRAEAARVDGGLLSDTRDRVVDVPPGGRAVFLVNAPPEEIADLARAGGAESLHLRAGPTAWIVPEGERLLGVTLG